ncbi:lysophospholipid acyltransferase family protein [Orbus sturtevantii]|uniref:lysophospholipid acyltransferase family protein n=1 Tax=Orbus sturtevantii TaxID=3074109 RepID=UPI00370D4714
MKKLFASAIRIVLLISCKLVTGVQSRWLSEPYTYRPKIYYANHTSHLDGLVLWSCFPRCLRSNIRPIAAKDYWQQTKFKQFIAQDIFNSVLINRKPNNIGNPLLILGEILKKQQSIILFPEGTRGCGSNIADFKSGLFYLSKHFPDIELVPVYLNNLNRVLPKGSKLLVPIICSAIFGSPINSPTEDETKKSFLARAKLELEKLAP